MRVVNHTKKLHQIHLIRTRRWEVGGGYNGSNDCNTLRGTDGQQFHPDVSEDERLWIFQTDLCRVMFLEFQAWHSQISFGVRITEVKQHT